MLQNGGTKEKREERRERSEKKMRALAEGCLEGRIGRAGGRRRRKGGRRGKCRIRCDIVNATVN